MTESKWSGRKAWGPVQIDVDGKKIPVIAQFEYMKPGYVIETKGHYDSMDDADLAAWERNRTEGLSPDDVFTVLQSVDFNRC